MKPIYHIQFLLLCAHTSLVASAPTITESATENVELLDMQLLKQLGSGSFSERESATRTIWELGDVMLPHLKSVSASDDPELASRATMLIQNIEAGIFPTTNKAVLQAIAEYNNSQSLHSKIEALESLRELRAYKQALYLLRNEKDDAVRKKLSREHSIRQLARAAAYSELTEGRIDEAISILRLAPYEEFNLRALAHLLKQNGQLDQELEQLEAQEMNAERQLWKLTLLQTKGDIALLKEFAQDQRLDAILSVIAMLEGNPHLILNELIERSHEDLHRNALKTLKSTYQKNSTDLAAEFTQSLDDPQDDTLLLYQSAISMLLGQRSTGESLLELASKSLASGYYQGLESSAQELRLFGCPDPNLDYASFQKWVVQQISLELDLDQNHLDHESDSKIESLARFYYQRGKKEEAGFIYKEYLQAVRKNDEESWRDTLANMPQYGMAELMLKFIYESKPSDEDLHILSNRIFGDSPDVDKLWEELAKHNQGKQEQFRELCTLMSLPRSSSEGATLEKQLRENAKDYEAAERLELIEALAYAAEQRGDYVQMLNYYKQLTALDVETEHYITKYREAATLQLDWQGIIDSYALQPEFVRNNPIALTRYALAHKELGKEGDYQELIQRAKTLTLGDAKILNNMAMVFHECGYQEEALEVWMQNLAGSTSTSWGFFMSLSSINNFSYQLINQEEWKKASAFSIVEAAIHMDPSAYPLNSAITPLRLGFAANFTYGMALLESGKRKQAIEFLNYAHNSLTGDGVLANHFFPSLLKVSLKKERDRWFRASWEKLENELKMFPEAHNTHNTIAWLGSRATSNLPDSMRHSEIALRIQPNQPAYLDSLAEVYFAMGDRKSAIKTSHKALHALTTQAGEYKRRSSLRQQHATISSMFWDLSHQHARFVHSPLPASITID
ncbi:hypothetical protein [Rubritalea sp.]|uniref:hypothetical protein n=1 Tax=Rubritalea sp. TaxID=2109375 RepID=UPI003EF95A1E